jgi:general secretion pathway protein G
MARRRRIPVILILVAAAVGFSIPIYRLRSESAGYHAKVRADIQGISTQLTLYESMNGFYPTTEQGLKALVMFPNTAPTPHRWYQTFEHLPKDPWGNDYVYRCPGSKNRSTYDLFSPGPDHKADTADDDWGQ